MKVPPKRKGNSHPKLARNDAAETGTTREPRGRPTQKVYPNQPTHAQTSVTSQNITRATRHIYVTYQVLAQTKTPPDPLVEHPAGVFTYKLFGAVHAFTLHGSAASGGRYSDSPSMPSRANAVKRDTARKYFF